MVPVMVLAGRFIGNTLQQAQKTRLSGRGLLLDKLFQLG